MEGNAVGKIWRGEGRLNEREICCEGKIMKYGKKERKGEKLADREEYMEKKKKKDEAVP